MTTYEEQIRNEYFNWMTNIVCGDRYPKQISYRKLLTHLYNTEFTYILDRDRNRAEDGIDLRDRFFYDNPDLQYNYYHLERYLEGPCSVLEMMVALTIRCEESIMDDPRIGDRTRQWFWGMVTSLGLGGMTDDRYDRLEVDEVLSRFLNREYSANGKGGLFTIRDCNRDLRDVEIWYQLNWYLNTIM